MTEQDNNTESSILNLNVDDAVDLVTLPDNSEVELRIEAAEIKHSQKDGSPYLNLRCSVPAEAAAEDIFHIIMLPKEEEKANDFKSYNRSMLRFKEFYAATNTPSGAVDLRELVGKTFYAILGTQQSDQYGLRNTVKRLVIPR